MEHLVLATYPIINDCNISCPWCAAHLKSQPIFNTRHVLGALSRIPHAVHGVALTGGEPFTRPDILDIKGELEWAGHRVFAITNGTLHDKIFEFINGETLDVALSVHNPSLFPEWIVKKKSALLDECRARGLKIMAALFSVDGESDIEQAVGYILANRNAVHTATLSTVYRRGTPAMAMDNLLYSVLMHLPDSSRVLYHTPGKSVVDVDGFLICLRRSPTVAEYGPAYDIPGCLFLAWDGEFHPVALAQYLNEEVLA